MPDINKLHTVPLTEEEQHHLMTVYNTRLPFFALVFGIFILAGIYFSLAAYTNDDVDPYDYEVFGYVLMGEDLFLFVLLLLESMIFFIGIKVFLKNIYAYKKDALCGRKEVALKTVTDKKYFPNTNQYYISFNDPNYMHHEVDADTFYSLHVGDTVPIYRGVYSKHVFQKDARFTFM
jgi:hypothetical protein